jgi:hypothetical protein
MDFETATVTEVFPTSAAPTNCRYKHVWHDHICPCAFLAVKGSKNKHIYNTALHHLTLHSTKYLVPQIK